MGWSCEGWAQPESINCERTGRSISFAPRRQPVRQRVSIRTTRRFASHREVFSRTRRTDTTPLWR